LSTQLLYYSHIIHITTISIPAAIIFCGVGFYSSFWCVNMGFVGIARKDLNKGKLFGVN
jgi:hypothetical protein